MGSLGWLNRESRVLTVLFREGPLTIKEIADRTEMSYANAWNVLQELMAEEIVRRWSQSWTSLDGVTRQVATQSQAMSLIRRVSAVGEMLRVVYVQNARSVERMVIFVAMPEVHITGNMCVRRGSH